GGLPGAPRPASRIPCICLLPPQSARLPPNVAKVLDPQTLQSQGLLPLHLENYSESALLKAIRQGIEQFYPQAFRPDPSVKMLQEYLDHLDADKGQPNSPSGISPSNGKSTRPNEATALPKEDKFCEDKFCEDKFREDEFREEVGLPLNMRFPGEQLDPRQLPLPENLTSRQIHCYWLDGDAPLLSSELTRQLYDNHHRYAAEFSFSDIYPRGFTPLLFQAAILSRLWHLRQKSPSCEDEKTPEISQPSKEAPAPPRPAPPMLGNLPNIQDIAERNLNLFAAEPLLCAKDYRPLRLDLRAGSKRQYQTLRNIYQNFFSTPAPTPPTPAPTQITTPAQPPQVEQILQWIENSAAGRRTLPRYFPIQISAFCPQTCAYCPYPKIMGPEFFPPQIPHQSTAAFMPRQLWRDLLAAIVAFTEDAVINLSPLGEPLLHPEFTGFIEDLLEYPSLELVIETSGVRPDAEQWKLEDLPRPSRPLTWIVSLDALDPKLYQQLRASNETISPQTGMTPSQQQAHALVEYLLNAGQSVHVQAVRMKDNEADLEDFYRYWTEGRIPASGSAAQALRYRHKIQTDIKDFPAKRFPKVIIQKYNSYAGFLPERQLLRLDPPERLPCRRLAREMVFSLDGQAYLCVQDLQQDLASRLKPELGCFPQQSLPELWHLGQSLYRQHIEKNYPKICRDCDEYYVYNF
ncbi:MAG: spiro-SPASM protein, partial [Spirochaetota bacterium]